MGKLVSSSSSRGRTKTVALLVLLLMLWGEGLLNTERTFAEDCLALNCAIFAVPEFYSIFKFTSESCILSYSFIHTAVHIHCVQVPLAISIYKVYLYCTYTINICLEIFCPYCK